MTYEQEAWEQLEAELGRGEVVTWEAIERRAAQLGARDRRRTIARRIGRRLLAPPPLPVRTAWWGLARVIPARLTDPRRTRPTLAIEVPGGWRLDYAFEWDAHVLAPWWVRALYELRLIFFGAIQLGLDVGILEGEPGDDYVNARPRGWRQLPRFE